MTFLKRWKTNWELKSFSFDQLYNIISDVIMKQLGEIKLSPSGNLASDYDADSVDVVTMLLLLEKIFQNASSTTRTIVPTNKIGDIESAEDILDIMYELLLSIENQMDPFVKIQPDFSVLNKVKEN